MYYLIKLIKLLRSFISRDVNLLLRAYLVYVRPLLEYCTIVWSPSLIQDIEAVESVHRKFTKRLPELCNYSYVEWLKKLELQSLELRRLHLDLIWCYKIVFQCVNVNMSDCFNSESAKNPFFVQVFKIVVRF